MAERMECPSDDRAIKEGILQAIENARPYSWGDWDRDVDGVLRKIAHYRHKGDVEDNGRETMSGPEIWAHAKDLFYRWALDCNEHWPIECFPGLVHSLLNAEAFSSPEPDKWDYAQRKLATRVLEYTLGNRIFP